MVGSNSPFSNVRIIIIKKNRIILRILIQTITGTMLQAKER